MFDEELSHRWAIYALRTGLVSNFVNASARNFPSELATKVAGVQLPSPIGLAAGFDKDCLVLEPMGNIGFGFVCGGTVTLAARDGNPKPRLIRKPAQSALVNAFGFPSDGLGIVTKRIGRLREIRNRTFISISGNIEDEILECYRRLSPVVAGIELNISSPNSAGLRGFQEPARLRGLLELIRNSNPTRTPLLVKLPPWAQDSDDRKRFLSLVETAVSAGADGLVIANTKPVDEVQLAKGFGGLSGQPLKDDTERMTAEVAALVGKNTNVVSCGGIGSPQDVWRMLAAGASAVQLYTAMIYEGPSLPGRLNAGLSNMMELAGIRHVSDIQGPPPNFDNRVGDSILSR